MGYMASYYNIPKAIFHLRKGDYNPNIYPFYNIVVSIFFSIIHRYSPNITLIRGTIGPVFHVRGAKPSSPSAEPRSLQEKSLLRV